MASACVALASLISLASLHGCAEVDSHGCAKSSPEVDFSALDLVPGVYFLSGENELTLDNAVIVGEGSRPERMFGKTTGCAPGDYPLVSGETTYLRSGGFGGESTAAKRLVNFETGEAQVDLSWRTAHKPVQLDDDSSNSLSRATFRRIADDVLEYGFTAIEDQAIPRNEMTWAGAVEDFE